VLVPKVEAFRRQYAELHPGLLRAQHTQQAQQTQQVQQAQQKAQQAPGVNPSSTSMNLPPMMGQQRQQQVCTCTCMFVFAYVRVYVLVCLHENV